MQEQHIIYKENLTLSIDQELKYQKMLGSLRNDRLFKKCLPIIIAFSVFAVITGVSFATEPLPFALMLLLAAVGSVLICFLYRRNIKKGIVSLIEISYYNGMCSDSPKKVIFKQKGIEKITPYSKAYVPYEDIEFAISDPASFTLKIRGNDLSVVIPKNGQNPDVLFNIDNILRESLKDKFIYEM